MEIRNSTANDIEDIFKIYEQASAYKLQVGNKGWKGFKLVQVQKEIAENRHFVILEGQEIACTFLLTFKDVIIWKESANDTSIYIHRIATNPLFRGNSYVTKIVTWAKEYAIANEKKYIRLDTHSGNDKINTYYISCGFTFKGVNQINWTPELPEHYKEGSFSLFEIAL
jgi:ribosomal protein S18 acetylase RimI-like enzyme